MNCWYRWSTWCTWHIQKKRSITVHSCTVMLARARSCHGKSPVPTFHQNEVSIKLAIEEMALRTNWKCKLIETRSVSDSQRKECHCAPPESWKWLKRAQYQISSTRNDITHFLQVEIGRNELSIQLSTDGMALRTGWEFKLVKWGQYKLAADGMALHTF